MDLTAYKTFNLRALPLAGHGVSTIHTLCTLCTLQRWIGCVITLWTPSIEINGRIVPKQSIILLWAGPR